MPIFEGRAATVTALAALALGGALAVAACLAPGTCLRNSDCDSNLACSAGKCVAAPDAGDLLDGGLEGSITSVVSDAAIVLTTPPDAGTSSPTSNDASPASDASLTTTIDDGGADF